MKRKADGAQQARHINQIGELVSTAQRSPSLAQAINQRVPKLTIWNYHTMKTQSEQHQPKRRPTLKQLVMSILGAAFGVQNSETQHRDFQQTSPMAYIVGGIVFGVLFVITLILLVKFILS